MQNIFVIRSHYPDVRAQKEAATLSRNGWKVTLVVWDRGRFSYLNADTSHDYRIKRFGLKVPMHSLKVAFYLPVWCLFVMLQLLIERWDAVHAVDFDCYVPALFIAKLRRKPIVYDIADFYADMIGFPILPGLSRKIIAKIDRTLMKFADVIILPNESIIKQVGLDPRKKPIVIVNNSPDQDILRGIVSRSLKDKPFTVFYGGGVVKVQGIIEMCLAVKDLCDVQLFVTGPCSQSFEAELREMCKNIDNVKLNLRLVPFKEVITEIMNAHLLIGLYDPAVPNNRFASPNKLFEAMMCGKPIIVSDGSTMTEIVRDENCGLIVPYGDIAAIREAIAKLKNDPDLRQRLGANGRRAYEEKYGWQIMEQRLLDSYRTLGSQASKKPEN
jgi:glycosyltransferase involved in cell wall biosynthesis